MLSRLMLRLRALLPSPAKRRADQKRRLEHACQAHGCSRAAARRITADYFGGDK